MVVIWAWWMRVSCLVRWAFSGCSSTASDKAWLIRSRICAAAALVKVTTSSRSMSTG